MDRPNLIQFPVEKTRKSREDVSVQLSLNTLTDRRRIGFVLSLMSVVMLAVYMNPQAQNFDVVRYSADGGRMIASVESGAPVLVRDTAFERDLAREVARASRTPASFGREPSSLDRLRDEELKSRYRIVYKDQFISEIFLQQGQALEVKPVDIQNRQKLLERYKALFYAEAERVEPQLHEGSMREETYAFVKGDQVLGRATVLLDRSGGFYSLKIQ